MNVTKASNKKCPFQFNQGTRELNYCITDLCMSWFGDDEKGYCSVLTHKCKQGEHDS